MPALSRTVLAVDAELLGAGYDQDFLSIGLVPLAALLRKHALAGAGILRNPGHAGLHAISLSPECGGPRSSNGG